MEGEYRILKKMDREFITVKGIRTYQEHEDSRIDKLESEVQELKEILERKYGVY